MKLVPVSAMSAEWRSIRNGHYVPNHGNVGRQIHYLVYRGGGFMEHPIAAIAAGSAVFACAGRDSYFGVDSSNRGTLIQRIVNNTVFRLLDNEKNLASIILKQWRRAVMIDWPAMYGDSVIGFETFVYGDNRTGACYKADGWCDCGLTSGVKQSRPVTIGGVRQVGGQTVGGGGKKIILCRMADNSANEQKRRCWNSA